MRRIVAIGGPHGSGKSSVAQQLAEHFQMNYVSAGSIFRKLAKDRNISLEDFSKQVMNEPAIDVEIDDRTKELGQLDNTIVDAQLAAHFTPSDSAIKICITASPETRWQRIAHRESRPLELATQETKIREKTERERFLNLYQIDVADLSLYDIVINNDRIDQDVTVEICKSIIQGIFEQYQLL